MKPVVMRDSSESNARAEKNSDAREKKGGKKTEKFFERKREISLSQFASASLEP